jgi:hypothetical protein
MWVGEMQPDSGVVGFVLTDRGVREPGPREVTVAMAVNSINRRDFSTIENAGAWGTRFPLASKSGGRHADAYSR